MEIKNGELTSPFCCETKIIFQPKTNGVNFVFFKQQQRIINKLKILTKTTNSKTN